MYGKILLIGLAGSFINLDEHTAVQSMICRPIAAGPLIGLLLGDVRTGIIVGIILELLLFRTLPVGVSMPINFSMVTILATGLILVISELMNITADTSLIMFVLFFTIPTGLIFKEVEVMNRKFNIELVHKAEEKIIQGKLNYVEIITYLSILIAFAKNFIYISLSMIIGLLILPWAYLRMPARVLKSFDELFVLIISLGFAIAIGTFGVVYGKKARKINTD